MVSNRGTTKNIIKDPLIYITPLALQNSLREIQTQFNFDLIGMTDINAPITIDFYRKWLARGYHGEMSYLKEHLPTKESPTQINATLKSVISIGQNYFPTISPLNQNIPARIALYAQNTDYHFWLKEKLQQTITKLQSQYPNEVFLPFVDSGPILERDTAFRAGLGWFGKNTCMINSQKGSLFFIAEILTSLNSTDTIPLHADLCGQCDLCITSCPTGAIEPERTLNAQKCISYLTIESKKVPPPELRTKIHDWFFGCDICQTVCPWNQKKINFFNTQANNSSNTTSSKDMLNLPDEDLEKLILFFKELLSSSNKKIQKKFHGTALFRAGGFGLKRNALIVIGNRKLSTLHAEVSALTQDAKLGELAHWTLNQLTK